MFIGPIWPKTQALINQSLAEKSNVFFLGKKSYEKTPSLINNFDAAIIPHKIDNFIKTTDPMKMYEFLALGKPVITTKGAGVTTFKNCLYIAENKQEFNNLLKKALTENSIKLINQRKNVIKEHSWKKRVEKKPKLMIIIAKSFSPP